MEVVADSVVIVLGQEQDWTAQLGAVQDRGLPSGVGRQGRQLHFFKIAVFAAPSRLFEPVMQPPAAWLCAGLTEPAESRCSLYTCTSNLCICTNIHLCFGGQLSLLGVLPHPRRARRA